MALPEDAAGAGRPPHDRPDRPGWPGAWSGSDGPPPYSSPPHPPESYPSQPYSARPDLYPYPAPPRYAESAPAPLGGVQRPAVIAISASMVITASLLWMAMLGFGLLVAVSIRASFSTSAVPEAAVYHIAERFQLRMSEGLAVPLFGLPAVSVVAGFLLLVRRPWARISYTAVGVLAVCWSLWWLNSTVAWWVPAAVYIAISVAILWSPGVGRWYAGRD